MFEFWVRAVYGISGDTSFVSEKPTVTEDETGGSKTFWLLLRTTEVKTAGCQSKTSIDLWLVVSCCLGMFEEERNCSSIEKMLHLVDTL